MRFAGRWWAVDDAGQWLVYDDASQRWKVSDVHPEGEPEDADVPPPSPPSRPVQPESGVESLRQHERDVVESLMAQVRQRVREEVEFVGLCFSPSRGLASARAYLRDMAQRLRAPITTGQIDRSWVAIAVTRSKVYAFACVYLPVDVDVYPRRMKASAQLEEDMGAWDRSATNISLTDLAVATRICLGSGANRLCVYAPKAERMSRELVRLLRESS